MALFQSKAKHMQDQTKTTEEDLLSEEAQSRSLVLVRSDIDAMMCTPGSELLARDVVGVGILPAGRVGTVRIGVGHVARAVYAGVEGYLSGSGRYWFYVPVPRRPEDPADEPVAVILTHVLFTASGESHSDRWSARGTDAYPTGFFIQVGSEGPLTYCQGADPQEAFCHLLQLGLSIGSGQQVFVWQAGDPRPDVFEPSSVGRRCPVGEPRVFAVDVKLREVNPKEQR